MPTLRTPLIGSYNNRSFAAAAGKDQLFKGCLLTPIVNKQGRTVTYYLEKRTGLESDLTPSSGNVGSGVYTSHVTSLKYSTFAQSSINHLFAGTTDCGIIGTSGTIIFSEYTFSGITYIMLSHLTSVNTGIGWFLPSDAIATTAYTADGNNSTTITDIKVSGVNSVAGLYVGQKLTAGANIVAGSRIVSINAGAFSAELDTATTGGAFNDLAITKEPVAKIIDADFPTDIVGGFVEMNGYVGIMTYAGRFHASDQNTVISWSASNFLTANKYSDVGCGAVRYKDNIIAFSSASLEFLYYAGNLSGSPFSSSQNAIVSRDIAPLSSAFGFTCPLINERPYWLGSDGNIYTLEGFSHNKISTLGMQINRAAFNYLSGFYYNGKSYLLISCATEAAVVRNYLYCVDDETVTEAGFGSVRAYASNFPSTGLVSVVLNDTSGKVFQWRDQLGASSTFLDNGSAFTMASQLATDMGTNSRKFVIALRLNADRQASGSLSVSFSDDEGANYSSAQSIPLTSNRMELTGSLGSFEGTRLWKLEHSANTPFRGKMIEIDYETA